jgi:hypothetical protein
VGRSVHTQSRDSCSRGKVPQRCFAVAQP